MEKYEITIKHGEDETFFTISKTSTVLKLSKFIEMYYDDLKSSSYQIRYNGIDIKQEESSGKKLSEIFDSSKSISSPKITLDVVSSGTTEKLQIICKYNSKSNKIVIDKTLSFQKLKFAVLAFYPELDEENYEIKYNEEDISNIFANDVSLDKIFKSESAEIELVTQPKMIIEIFKRCSYCHDAKANYVCHKCAMASCENCSKKDLHYDISKTQLITLPKFDKFCFDTLTELLKALSKSAHENEKVNSDNFVKNANDMFLMIGSKFDEMHEYINSIKKEQIDSLKILMNSILTQYNPEQISADIKKIYALIEAYKKNPYCDCEESMKKIIEFERMVRHFLDAFSAYLKANSAFNDKYRMCNSINKKILDFLSNSLNETKLLFKTDLEITQYKNVMKIYDNSSVLVYDKNLNKFSLMNFHDEDFQFKDNFNNFIQINYCDGDQEKIFCITGTPCQKLFCYDLKNNEMQFIANMKFSHNWWPSLIAVKRESEEEKENVVQKNSDIVLFCLSGSYTNKCEMLIFSKKTAADLIVDEKKKPQESLLESQLEGIPVVEHGARDSLGDQIHIDNPSPEANPNESNAPQPNEEKANPVTNPELDKTIKNPLQSQLTQKPGISPELAKSLMKWEEIPSTTVTHGQGASFIYNNQYIYLLFGYDSSQNPITVIERLDIKDISALLSPSAPGWENLQFKNPDNISSILYYNVLMKVDDNNIFILGGLVEIDQIDFIYKYSCKDNALVKTDKKIDFKDVQFMNEKNLTKISKENALSAGKKGEYAVIDGKNNVHIVEETTFKHSMLRYTP